MPDNLQSILKHNGDHFISVKERHFFERTSWGLNPEIIDQYQKWFPRPEGKKTGEFTPRYIYDFWVAEQLRVAAPNSKILVMLRDPVERYWSGCTFSGMDPKTFNEHFQQGLYAQQLERWHKHFDRDSVLIVQFERFNKQPVESFQEICRFIGIDDTVAPAGDQVDAVVNASGKKEEMPKGLRKNLIDSYAEDVKHLAEMHPQLDLSLWKNFRS